MAVLKENQGLYTLILSGVSVMAMALMMFTMQAIHADVKDSSKDITEIKIDVATLKTEMIHGKEKIDMNTERIDTNTDRARRQREVINREHPRTSSR